MAAAKKKRDKPGKVVEQARVSLDVVHTHPSVRVSTMWTPKRVRDIQSAADSGSLAPVCDLCEQIIVDDRASQCLQTLSDSVLGAELKWEPGLRRTSREAVQLETEVDDDWWESYQEAEYAQILKWREVLGFATARVVWQKSATSDRVIPVVVFWHPRLFRFDNEKRQWYVRVSDEGLEEPITPNDGEWLFFYRQGSVRPWANGSWRGISRWWMLKAYAISDWGIHSEKASRQVVTAEEGVSAADRKALAADLMSLAKDGVVSLPKGFTYALVEATSNTRQIYEAQINSADQAITIAILAQNLTTSITENGSRAASETHERKEARKVRYVAESLSTTIREAILGFWAEFNFGDRTKAPWPVWQVTLPEDSGEKATTLSVLADAVSKFQHAGWAIPAQYLEDEFGLTLEETETPEERAVRLQPKEPGAPGSAKPGQKPGQQPGQKPGQKPALRNRPTGVPHALAAAVSRTPRGFIRSQLYADDVADRTREHAASDLEGFVGKLLAAIGAADDYDSIREAVHAAYAGEADPDRLADLVEHALVMAELGGRLGQHEDLE